MIDILDLMLWMFLKYNKITQLTQSLVFFTNFKTHIWTKEKKTMHKKNIFNVLHIGLCDSQA